MSFAPIVQFNGVADVIDFSYTMTPGINPGIVYIRAAVENVAINSLGVGTLSVYDPYTTNSITLPDCLPVEISQSVTGANIITIIIQDRRWKWAHGTISGYYNKREPDSDDILSGTEKTPQELAGLLLDAMGETGYNVASLPNGPRPEVMWERVNPAKQLASLCSQLGCRIVINSENRVVIWREGVGSLLPFTSDLVLPSAGFGNSLAPKKVVVYSSPTLIDRRFELEAVALDTDGKYYTFTDANLDYHLAAGEYFDELMGSIDLNASTSGATDENKLKFIHLAQTSVYRAYRVIDNAFNKDGLDNLWQIELFNNVLDKDEEDRRKPIEVIGVFYDQNLDKNTSENTIWYGGQPRLDPKRKIVYLPQQCYKLDNNTPSAATIALRCTCRYRENTTFSFRRLSQEEEINSLPWGTLGEESVIRDDVVSTERRTYTGLITPDSTTNNSTNAHTKLNYYAEREAAKYNITTAGSGQYRGLQLFELDGVREYIEFFYGTRNPFSTVIVLNQRKNNYIPTYRDRFKKEIEEQENNKKIVIAEEAIRSLDYIAGV